MVTFRFRKFLRDDNTFGFAVYVNENQIFNVPNAQAGAKSIYPFIDKRDIN
jgi:hypothetical protein